MMLTGWNGEGHLAIGLRIGEGDAAVEGDVGGASLLAVSRDGECEEQDDKSSKDELEESCMESSVGRMRLRPSWAGLHRIEGQSSG